MNESDILNLLIEDDDIWISSYQLSYITGKLHKNVVRDIKQLQIKIKDMVLKFEHRFEEEKEKSMESGYLEKLKIKKKYVMRNFRKEVEYLLNREMATELLMNYSFEIRLKIQTLFWKVSDKLKEHGYKHSNISEMDSNIDDLFTRLKYNSNLSIKAYLNQDIYDVDKIDPPTIYLESLITKTLEPIKDIILGLEHTKLNDDYLSTGWLLKQILPLVKLPVRERATEIFEEEKILLNQTEKEGK